MLPCQRRHCSNDPKYLGQTSNPSLAWKDGRFKNKWWWWWWSLPSKIVFCYLSWKNDILLISSSLSCTQDYNSPPTMVGKCFAGNFCSIFRKQEILEWLESGSILNSCSAVRSRTVSDSSATSARDSEYRHPVSPYCLRWNYECCCVYAEIAISMFMSSFARIRFPGIPSSLFALFYHSWPLLIVRSVLQIKDRMPFASELISVI